jgi:hypothetical protein
MGPNHHVNTREKRAHNPLRQSRSTAVQHCYAPHRRCNPRNPFRTSHNGNTTPPPEPPRNRQEKPSCAEAAGSQKTPTDPHLLPVNHHPGRPNRNRPLIRCLFITPSEHHLPSQTTSDGITPFTEDKAVFSAKLTFQSSPSVYKNPSTIYRVFPRACGN